MRETRKRPADAISQRPAAATEDEKPFDRLLAAMKRYNCKMIGPLKSSGFIPTHGKACYENGKLSMVTVHNEKTKLAAPLNMHLEPEALKGKCMTKRLRTPCTVNRYGTPRVFGTSQVASKNLTIRGMYEVPNVLYFSKEYKDACRTNGITPARKLSPKFLECLMGYQRDWTSLESRRRPKQNFVPRRLKGIGLFSGIGGMEYSLQHAVKFVLAVDKDPACRKLLQHLMDTNRLETSKIRPDVREITAADGFRADIVCGGSPCQDLARGGKQAGLDGDRSSLVFDLIRIGFYFWDKLR